VFSSVLNFVENGPWQGEVAVRFWALLLGPGLLATGAQID
jgi:hypothetical protein